MLHMLSSVFLGVFANVSYTCFKGFSNCLHLYVATVVSGYFKNRSGVAHVRGKRLAARACC
jgi:hypothetical protein